MTYGSARYRVLKECPGVDLALIDGYLLDRYTAILDRLKWRRLDSEVVLMTVAPYTTGTLAVVNGSANVTLTGGTLTAAMTGRAIRINAGDDWYEFTYASASTGTLDRAFDGTTNALATYSIYQSIYPLPADCRILNAINSVEFGPLARLSKSQLDASAAARTATGQPQAFAPYMDDGATPPNMQVELYPVPDAVYALPMSYTAEAAAIAGSTTALLPWLRPSALVAGATSDALEHLGNFARADRQAAKYEGYLADMIRTEALNRGPQRLQMADWLTRHNMVRALRSNGASNGPTLP